MSPPIHQYLARSLEDGTMRTIMGYSLRGAARNFARQYRLTTGYQFQIRLRESGDAWSRFSVTSAGVRQLAD